jgi:hypothetical protein
MNTYRIELWDGDYMDEALYSGLNTGYTRTRLCVAGGTENPYLYTYCAQRWEYPGKKAGLKGT